MKRTYLFSGTLLLLLVGGCSWFKTEEKTLTYGNLKIAWRESFNTDQLYGSSMPAIFENKVVFSNYPATGKEFFFALDADKGGKESWRWGDYINENDESVGSQALPVTFNNIMCIAPSNGLIGVDMRTGETVWKQNFSSSGFVGKFERCAIREGRTGDEKAFLKFIDIETGAARTVLEIDTMSSPFFGFTTPVAFRDGTGDTLLYFSFGQAIQQPNGSLTTNSSFYAYNITDHKIVWQKKGLSAAGIIDGQVLYLASDSLYAFDVYTGNRIWANLVSNNGGKFVKTIDNKVIISGEGPGSFIQAFNKNNGAFEWGVPYNGGASEPIIHNGIVYFTCSSDGLLYAIRISNGQVIWKEKCPDQEDDSGSFWSFGVNVDPVRNKLYVASFTGAFCLEPAQ